MLVSMRVFINFLMSSWSSMYASVLLYKRNFLSFLQIDAQQKALLSQEMSSCLTRLVSSCRLSKSSFCSYASSKGLPSSKFCCNLFLFFGRDFLLTGKTDALLAENIFEL